MSPSNRVPCVLYEDEHLLAVNKPAGWNTHAPGPYAGEGLYEWLRHREARWAGLAIIHRLDKETSGVLVFAKTPLASQSLTRQFTAREIHKRYLLLTDRPVPDVPQRRTSHLARVGDRYRSQRSGDTGCWAETLFQRLEARAGRTVVEALPATGRTHQIRVHAADAGFPVLGDRLYGGTAAARLHLHAAALTLRHPATGETVTFSTPPDWETEVARALRDGFISPTETEVYRLIHGAADGWPGWYVDRLGSFLLSQAEAPLTAQQEAALGLCLATQQGRGAYHKRRDRRVRESAPEAVAPQLIRGEAAPPEFTVRENGLRFALRLGEGYSVGLFLDQRDNRRRLLTGYVGAGFPVFPARPGQGEVLNLFAYTCAFSVCAASAGARVTSVDLSRKYLDWGRRNFVLNQLDPAAHEFLHGDAFDWLRRWARKRRSFDGVLVDPPTFSTSKVGGRFRAEADWPRLAQAVLAVLKPGGLLFASTNAARLEPGEFIAQLTATVRDSGRRILAEHFAPQPPDFPVCRAEPAHLKTLWLRVG